MKTSLTQKRGLLKFAAFIGKRVDKWWAKALIVPLLTTVPLALFWGVYRFIPSGSVAGENDEVSSQILAFITKYSFWSVVIVIAYVTLVNAVVEYLRELATDNRGIDVASAFTLFAILEKVVEGKGQRFHDQVESIFGSKSVPSDGAVFREITRPDFQIRQLISGIHAFFETIDKRNASFCVSLARVEKGKIIGWAAHAPLSEPPKTSIALLNQCESAASQCIKKKKIIVVEDCEKEAAKKDAALYVPREGEEGEDRSLVCYPIVYNLKGKASVIYVISVVADVRKYFRPENRELYKWLFRHFAVRIVLEHSLMALKQAVTKQGDQDAKTPS